MSLFRLKWIGDDLGGLFAGLRNAGSERRRSHTSRGYYHTLLELDGCAGQPATGGAGVGSPRAGDFLHRNPPEL